METRTVSRCLEVSLLEPEHLSDHPCEVPEHLRLLIKHENPLVHRSMNYFKHPELFLLLRIAHRKIEKLGFKDVASVLQRLFILSWRYECVGVATCIRML